MLGEAGRLKIVCALMGTRMCVAHLAGQVGMEQSALSHQLRNLKAAGLVRSEKVGKQVFYSLDDEHVYTIISQAVSHTQHRRKEF
jgi:ArsR family transcriptional regulator